MKRWAQRLVIFIAVLGILLAVGFGWSLWADPWTPEEVDQFMAECTDPVVGETDADTCRCLAEEIQERMSIGEFRAAIAFIEAGGSRSPDIRAARANCGL